MKTIKTLFIIGFMNFMLMLGVFSAATIIHPQATAGTLIAATTEDTLNHTAGGSSTAPTIETKRSPSIQITAPIKSPAAPVKASTTAPTKAPSVVLTKAPPAKAPTVALTKTPTAAPTTNPLAGKCIITVDGLRYDVTVFRTIHSGGNVFTCGADMSAVFHGQHPDSFLSKMAQYRV